MQELKELMTDWKTLRNRGRECLQDAKHQPQQQRVYLLQQATKSLEDAALLRYYLAQHLSALAHTIAANLRVKNIDLALEQLAAFDIMRALIDLDARHTAMLLEMLVYAAESIDDGCMWRERDHFIATRANEAVAEAQRCTEAYSSIQLFTLLLAATLATCRMNRGAEAEALLRRTIEIGEQAMLPHDERLLSCRRVLELFRASGDTTTATAAASSTPGPMTTTTATAAPASSADRLDATITTEPLPSSEHDLELHSPRNGVLLHPVVTANGTASATASGSSSKRRKRKNKHEPVDAARVLQGGIVNLEYELAQYSDVAPVPSSAHDELE